MAKKDLGGGSLLDQSHIIDLCIWLFGDIESVFGQFSKISNLEVETDDYTNAIINFKNGVKCFIHQDKCSPNIIFRLSDISPNVQSFFTQ